MPPAAHSGGSQLRDSPIPPAGRIGILIVGLGGNNGVTTLAGLIANRDGISWESSPPWGRMTANLLGCITQLPSRGGSGGYRERYPLANAISAAVGGWDIRPTPLGQALYASRILDYDLVRQVQDEMDQLPIMPGVWDPDFIGDSQHPTALHGVEPGLSQSQKLDRLRADIVRWKSMQGVEGHTTVIWSASVERPCLRSYATPQELLAGVEADDREISPSMLYAAAAALERCSFVNGGSQNTICPALSALAAENGCYILGTDFKAGQTKFKTAAVEYIRALGLSPQVLASSNHLGNNDMLNLTNKKTLDAKMRVKGDIFGPWQENIDHQVRVMYTPLIGDEKRDIVEYTSMGFMSCPHTMLTYTRAMDSALCVPLMIDVAVWCDFFSRCGAPSGLVGQATAYLFKVPEGGALGVDPGFFCQMQRLEEALEVAANSVSEFRRGSTGTDGSSLVRGGRIVCVGLSCLDLQLCGSTKGGTSETINTFTETKYCAGGSCPQVASVLAGMGLDRVTAITKVGADSHGNELVRLMQAAGVRCEQVIRDPLCQTALAVLPIFSDGGRGCYVNLAANNDFKPEEVENALRKVSAALPDEYQDCCRGVAAMHFGYPHFLPKMQGRALANLLASSQNILGEALISVDLNGVDNSDSARSRHDDVLGPSFPAIDLLHANEEEARAISGESGSMEAVGAWFLQRGVGIFAVTLGENGAYIAVADAARVAKSPALAHQALKWAGQCMKLPAFRVQDLSSINTNGAGDAFCAGMLVSLCWQQPLTLRQALQMGLLSSLQRVDGRLRDAGVKKSAKELMDGILNI